VGGGSIQQGPHPTGIIWRKVDTTLVPERYFRSMFAKRAERKLVAQFAERRRVMDSSKVRSEVPGGAYVRRDQARAPQTGRLPHGTLTCPACGSEVQPLGASSTPSEAGYRSEAYRAGWMDGRFKEIGSFVNNPNLVRWKTPSERLNYYHGYRAGSESRRRRRGGLPKAHERFLGRARP
jgi:hypothetical protein